MSLKVACGKAQDMKNSAAVHKDVALIPAEPQLMKCGCVLPFSRLCFLNNFAATPLLDVTPKPFSTPVSQKRHCLHIWGYFSMSRDSV